MKVSALIAATCTSILFHLAASSAIAQLNLGPVGYVATDSSIIKVPGYSVPSFARWNGDSLPDLIVGEGGGGAPEGKVRVYLNSGTASSPRFVDYFYAKSEGADLVCPGSG